MDITVYEYQQNSCYIDTLLICLLDNLSQKFVNDIIHRSYTLEDYNPVLCGDELLNIEETVNYASEVRRTLTDEYNLIHNLVRNSLPKSTRSSSHMNITCNIFRRILAKCLPSIAHRGKYVTYNVTDIYSLLTDLFPALKIKAPFEFQTNTKPKSRGSELISAFPMWDFVGKSIIEIKKGEMIPVEPTEYKEYLWEEFTCHILVFTNTSAPVILNFGDLQPERSTAVVGEGSYISIIEKQRVFDEVILGKYRLTAAIMLLDYIPGKESGTHYVSYFVDPQQRYYFYDDIGPKLINIDGYPPEIFGYTKDLGIPQLFIYARMVA